MSAIEAYAGKATIRFEDDPEGRERPIIVKYTVEQDDIWVGDGLEPVGGMKSWSGTFASTEFPVGCEFAELVLEDGRTGRIFINSIEVCEVTKMGDVWQAFAPTANGSFVGAGPAPC